MARAIAGTAWRGTGILLFLSACAGSSTGTAPFAPFDSGAPSTTGASGAGSGGVASGGSAGTAGTGGAAAGGASGGAAGGGSCPPIPLYSGEYCQGGVIYCKPTANDYAECSGRTVCVTCNGFSGPVTQNGCECNCDAHTSIVTCIHP